MGSRRHRKEIHDHSASSSSHPHMRNSATDKALSAPEQALIMTVEGTVENGAMNVPAREGAGTADERWILNSLSPGNEETEEEEPVTLVEDDCARNKSNLFEHEAFTARAITTRAS